MSKMKILEFKEIRSENFSHFARFEWKLFFWSKPKVCEVFRHKKNKIYVNHPEIRKSHFSTYNSWYCKDGYELGPNSGIILGQYLEHLESIDHHNSIKNELENIKI